MSVQAIERQHGHLRLAGPGRLEFGTEGDNQQYRQAADPLDGEIEQFARSWIGPMGILEDHDHRLPARQTVELAEQRLQCPVLLALRTEIGQRISLRSWQR